MGIALGVCVNFALCFLLVMMMMMMVRAFPEKGDRVLGLMSSGEVGKYMYIYLMLENRYA